MEWKENMQTGMPDMDELYMITFAKINGYLKDMSRVRTNMEFQAFINSIKAEFIKMFSYQEELMAKDNFPEYYKHKHHHEQFIENLNAYIIEKDDDFVGFDINSIENMTNDWVMKHIFMYDRIYSNYRMQMGLN